MECHGARGAVIAMAAAENEGQRVLRLAAALSTAAGVAASTGSRR